MCIIDVIYHLSTTASIIPVDCHYCHHPYLLGKSVEAAKDEELHTAPGYVCCKAPLGLGDE